MDGWNRVARGKAGVQDKERDGQAVRPIILISDNVLSFYTLL